MDDITNVRRKGSYTPGVLAKVVLLLTIAAIVAAVAFLIAKETGSRFPTLAGRVVDEAQIITEADKKVITGIITDHEGHTTNQIVVVTVKSLLGMPIEQFSRELGKTGALDNVRKIMVSCS